MATGTILKVESKPKGKGWAKVPHDIVDAAIPDTLKLLLWLCYDRPADWTYSVAEVANTMGKTPQCIRKYFRLLTAEKVFTEAGVRHIRHGSYPIYSFHPAQVDVVIKSQLMVNPETNPETDVETIPETDPDTGTSHTNTDLSKMIIKKDCTENGFTKGIGTALEKGSSLAEEFERLCNSITLQAPGMTPKEITNGQENGLQPPSPSVAPVWHQGSGKSPFQCPIPLSKLKHSIL